MKIVCGIMLGVLLCTWTPRRGQVESQKGRVYTMVSVR